MVEEVKVVTVKTTSDTFKKNVSNLIADTLEKTFQSQCTPLDQIDLTNTPDTVNIYKWSIEKLEDLSKILQKHVTVYEQIFDIQRENSLLTDAKNITIKTRDIIKETITTQRPLIPADRIRLVQSNGRNYIDSEINSSGEYFHGHEYSEFYKQLIEKINKLIGLKKHQIMGVKDQIEGRYVSGKELRSRYFNISRIEYFYELLTCSSENYIRKKKQKNQDFGSIPFLIKANEEFETIEKLERNKNNEYISKENLKFISELLTTLIKENKELSKFMKTYTSCLDKRPIICSTCRINKQKRKKVMPNCKGCKEIKLQTFPDFFYKNKNINNLRDSYHRENISSIASNLEKTLKLLAAIPIINEDQKKYLNQRYQIPKLSQELFNKDYQKYRSQQTEDIPENPTDLTEAIQKLSKEITHTGRHNGGKRSNGANLKRILGQAFLPITFKSTYVSKKRKAKSSKK